MKLIQRPKWRVGQRVRWTHRLPEKDIACDTGCIVDCRTRFAGTQLEHFQYEIRFDKPAIRQPTFQHVSKLWIGEDAIAKLVTEGRDDDVERR